jgi:ribosomal protein L13
VVVTNAEKIVFTGRKWDQKVYYWHTGWAGGLKVLFRHDDHIFTTNPASKSSTHIRKISRQNSQTSRHGYATQK